MQLMTSEISDIAETLDNELDEVKEEVERVQAERKAKHEFEHPPVPEGFTSIEDLQASLNLGEYGDRITDYTGNIGDAFSEIADGAVDLYTHDLLKWLPDNYEWLEEADFQGLLEGCKGDLIKMTQMAQYECFTQDMYSHQEDIAKYAALEGLAAEGVYALADEVYDDVFDGITIDFNDNNMDIEDFASEAQIAIQDAMDVPIYEAIDSNDEIMEDGELHWEYMSIKEGWGYNFPNPCAMSVEAVRTVNEKGYEAAFNEFWKDFMPEDHELAAVQDVTLIPVTLHFNETPDKSENMTFSAQDTNGLDIRLEKDAVLPLSMVRGFQVEGQPDPDGYTVNDTYGLVGSAWMPVHYREGTETGVKEDYSLALDKVRGADAIEAHGSDEPVSLKAAVKEAREASVALAGDDTHENIGQDAR